MKAAVHLIRIPLLLITLFFYSAAFSNSGKIKKTVNGPVPAGIVLTSASGTNNQSVCAEASITNITYSVYGTISSVTVTGLPVGVSESRSGNNFTISGAPALSGVSNYSISVLLTSGSTLTASGTITSNSTASVTNTITACDSYVWSANAQTYTTSGTRSTVVGCHTEFLNLTIVPSGPYITLSSDAATTQQSLCTGQSITNISYTVPASVGGVTVSSVSSSGLPPGVSGSLSNGSYVISGAPTVSGTFNYTVYLSGINCAIGSLTGTLTVSSAKGTSTLTLTSGTGSNNSTVCNNSAITSITYSVTGSYGANTITGVTASGLPTGVTGSLVSGVYTISGTPTAAGVYNYSIQTTGDLCTNGSATGTITVTATSSNTTTETACDSYTWSVNSQTYTTSGSYSSVSGCHTEYLNLTITASTSNTTTASACDSYTWGVDGQTYTTSGSYSSVSGCHTEYLNLTITASNSNTTTETACDSYTWAVNGQTYSNSGSYTSVTGCATKILNLTITASTSNTTTATACASYTWAVNSQVYTNSGTYSVVTGCHTEYLNLTIQNFSFTQFSVTGGGAYCSGGTGVAVGLSGSQSGVNYQLKLNGVNTGSPVAGTGSAISFGLKTTAGTYTVQATAASSVCTTAMTGSVTVSVNANPTAGITNNTGTTVLSATVVQISLTATGGTTYSWSNGSAVVGSTANYTVTAPGTYTVTVYNAAGCSSTASITITSSVLSVTGVVTHILCNGSKTGAINVTVSGGKPPYTYSWSSGQKTEDLTGLAAGTYTITVTDAAKVKISKSFTILQPTALVLNTTSTNLTCTGGLGTITPTASGGTAPYTITINTGASLVGGSFVGLTAGTYTVTLKDANNCSVIKTVVISAFVPVTFTTAVTPNSSCTSNGFITVTAKGGSAPYSYSKDGGTNWQTSNTLGALAAGVYSVKVKDANNCLSSAVNVTVTDNGSDGFETNNTQATAKVIVLETPNPARIGVVGDLDWYKYTTVTGSGGGTYYLVFAQAIAGQTYDLYDSKGKIIVAAATGVAGTGTVYKQYNALVAKTVYSIRIAGTNSLTCYKFKLSRTLPVAGLPLLALGANGNPSSTLFATFEGKLRAFPNPVKQQLQLEVENEADENAELIIRNAQGAAVYARRLGLVKSRQVIAITVNNLPAGFYVCQLVKASGTKTVKFLKE